MGTDLEVVFAADIPANGDVELSLVGGKLEGKPLSATEVEQIQLFRTQKIVVKQPRGFFIMKVALISARGGSAGLPVDDKGRVLQTPVSLNGTPDFAFSEKTLGNDVKFDTCAPSSIAILVRNPTDKSAHFSCALSGKCVL